MCDSRPVPARALGLVQGEIGAREEVVRRSSGARDADGDGDRDRRSRGEHDRGRRDRETESLGLRLEVARRRRTSASRTQNSSPPHRAIRSEPRVAACSRRATSHSTASPVLCPWTSLMPLNESTSTRTIAALESRARLAAVEEIREVAPVEESGQRVDAREPLEAPDRLGALLLQQALRGDVAGRSVQEDPSPTTVIRARSRTQRTTPSSPTRR